MAGLRIYSLGNLPEYQLSDLIQGGELGIADPVYDTGSTFSVEVSAPEFNWLPWLVFLGIAAAVLLSKDKN